MKEGIPVKETLIFEKIRQLGELPNLSKHEKIVQGILDAIDCGDLQVNDGLPSVNAMIAGIAVARETIVKAYKELISRGIIASKNRKGYFVIHANTRQQQKIAMLLFAFDNFQEALYRSFRNRVGDDIQVDLYFHHNNMDVFETMLHQITGNYSLYIIAPIPNKRVQALLSAIPAFKLLMIDRYIELPADYSYIVQEFRQSAYRIFEELKESFKAYKEIIFFFRDHTAEPNEIVDAFTDFLRHSGLKGRIENAYKPGSIKKRNVYFTIHNPELYAILKDVMVKGWEPGKDLAILSHNDDVVKEIIAGGITTFSTDFEKIGELAADYALTREKVQEVVPTVLFRRKSLS